MTIREAVEHVEIDPINIYGRYDEGGNFHYWDYEKLINFLSRQNKVWLDEELRGEGGYLRDAEASGNLTSVQNYLDVLERLQEYVEVHPDDYGLGDLLEKMDFGEVSE